ncbi:MAG: CHASE2 domain-containing protein [Muribaculaceae bacterium]|nr:CHASE2 domain-containing protein [Muribaculaceae bacterium]
MKRLRISSEKFSLVMKAAGMTALAFVLSWLLTAPFSASTSAIFSSPEKTDFILSDFYAQVADRRPVRNLSDRIVIIDIGRANRDEIAALIGDVGLCAPDAVGVDVNFEEARDDDSNLIAALASVEKIVMPVSVKESEGEDKFEIDDRPFFYGQLDNVKYGAVNLPGKFEGATIREFTVGYPIKGGGEQASFVTAIAEEVSPEKVNQLKERHHQYETIDYPSREIPEITIEEFYSRPESIEGKIVLIGALDEASDMHGTPVRSSMSGIKIHAHALSTVLDGSYYSSLPKWFDNAVAMMLCFFMILMSIGLTTKFKGIMIRIVQVILVYLAIRIGYSLYVDHRVIGDFSLTMLMIAFGTFAIDIWNGLEGLLTAVGKWIRKIKTKREKRLEVE